MNISAELIAIAILGVSLVSLGWKVTGDLRQEIHHMRNDVAGLGDRIGNLEQLMARLEGWMEGRFTEELELKAKPASCR